MSFIRGFMKHRRSITGRGKSRALKHRFGILREYLSKKEKEVEDFMLEMFTEEELEEMRRKKVVRK